MGWISGGFILVLVGIALRWVLGLKGSAERESRSLLSLDEERRRLYESVSRELETDIVILAISLNDAFCERDARHGETAWRLVQLAVEEWNRVAELTGALLDLLGKQVMDAHGLVPRSIAAQRFKSQLMIGKLRLHEFLERLVFRSKLRYQLQIHTLRRAVETLTCEFRRSYRNLSHAQDYSAEGWRVLDLYFHDFDLVTKETLIAFRALLAGLPSSSLADFGRSIESIRRHRVQANNAPIER